MGDALSAQSIDDLLGSVDLGIVESVPAEGGMLVVADSISHRSPHLPSPIQIFIEDDAGVDSDALMRALYDSGAFTNVQLRDAWSEFGLTPPSWL